MPPNLSPSSSALPATDSCESGYYESATRWFGKVLSSPSLVSGVVDAGRKPSLQTPGTQQIVREELPPAEASVSQAVLSPLRAATSALQVTIPGVSDGDDPLPASLIFGDSTEPHGGGIGTGSASSGSAQTAPAEAPPPAEAAGAKGGSRSSGAGGSGGNCGPSPSKSSAPHLQPDMPNDGDGIRDDGGSRSAGNDIVAEVTDIVAELSIGLTDSDGGGGGGGGSDSAHGGSCGSIGSGSASDSSTVHFAPLQAPPPARQLVRRVPLGNMVALPSGEDLMYAKPSEVTAEAERRAGTALVLCEGGVFWRVAQQLRESAAGRWLGFYLFGHKLTTKEEFDVTLLPPQELERVQRAFSFFDKDGSGSLEGDEVTAVLRVLGTNPQGKDEKAIFEQIDVDHDGKVSFSELAGLFWAQPRAAHAWEEWEELECAFEMLFPRRGPHKRNSLSADDLRGR